MSAAYQILREFADDRIMELVRLRLLFGLKFFENRTIRSGFTRDEVKLALLLVQIANPAEPFSADEKELLEARQQQKVPIVDSVLTPKVPRSGSGRKK